MNPGRDTLLAAVADLDARLAAITPRAPCWLIGSAAAALAGVDGLQPQDLDLLLGDEDAASFIEAHRAWLDTGHVPADSDRFRSRFARFRFGALPVEVMGGLQVQRRGQWQAITIAERLPSEPGARIALPSLREQVRLLEWFGRDKDLAKARLIRRHLARETASHAA